MISVLIHDKFIGDFIINKLEGRKLSRQNSQGYTCNSPSNPTNYIRSLGRPLRHWVDYFVNRLTTFGVTMKTGNMSNINKILNPNPTNYTWWQLILCIPCDAIWCSIIPPTNTTIWTFKQSSTTYCRNL